MAKASKRTMKAAIIMRRLVDGYDPLLKVVFTGEFKWNARHGKGRTEWYRTRTPADGGAPVEEVVKWVKGEWRNDARHGAFEEWRMSTGTPAEAAEVPIQASRWVERTVGEYVRGKRTTGTSYWDTGQKQYEGQWRTSRDSKHTVMHGEGTYYSRSGIKVYTGTFEQNLPHGQGRLFHKDGETRYYDGQWERGRWHGAGNHYNRNGILRYDGEFGQVHRIRICLEAGGVRTALGGRQHTRGDGAHWVGPGKPAGKRGRWHARFRVVGAD